VEDFLDRVRTSISGLRQRRLGERAVAARLITPRQLEEALRENGTDLGDGLVKRGWLTSSQVEELRRTLDSPDVIAGFARYELLDILGEGAMSVVHRARDRQLGRIVAVKVLRESMFGHPIVRERFAREAQALARLDHPAIVKVYDAGGDGGQAYLVMELVPGEPLSKILAAKTLDRPKLLRLLENAARGVHHAHEKGVIHRDLKPANVILESGKKAVVVDFGMSKIVTGAAGGTTNLTAHNMVFGTPEYMSPEQARGDELDARCDVYAAGVMLYEMLVGAPPFTGSTPLNVLTEHLTGVLEMPSKRAKDGRVTPALESVVMHALARDRDQRYPSASALAAAIMHARARPDDVVSLSPAAFATSPAGTDAFAVTMPAIGVSLSPPAVSSSDPAVHEPTSDTLLASGPPAAMSTNPPSRSPSSAPRSGSRTASRNPSSSPSNVPSVRPVIQDESTGTWILLWVLAGVASIGIGVYFALR
jgi:serine/threonine-protein kinase